MTVQSACKVVVRRLKERDQPLLEEMYSGFAPLAAALGLPPYRPVQRLCWLAALREGVNLVAFVDDHLAGHLALLPTGDGAEMTCFVHQDFRRQGLATALTHAAVEEARSAGYHRISVFIDTNNVAARRGLMKFGFQRVWEDLQEGEYVYPLAP
jgi:ribosomal protein S18 acetylase RimI-like enzyme